MKDVFENKTNSYYEIEGVWTSNPVVWNVMPAAVDVFTIFSQKLALLHALGIKVTRKTKGVATDKTAAREMMSVIGYKISKAITSFAAKNKNEELKAEAHLSERELLKGRDTDAINKARAVLAIAQGLTWQLADYNIGAAEIGSFDDAIDLYESIVDAPDHAKRQKKIANADLEKSISEMDDLLGDQMDGIVLQFKGDASKFFEQYTEARKVIPRGGKKVPGENDGKTN